MRSTSRKWTVALPLALVAAFAGGCAPAKTADPKPGTRGNADNVPYIGKSDPKGNPVRLAAARRDSSRG